MRLQDGNSSTRRLSRRSIIQGAGIALGAVMLAPLATGSAKSPVTRVTGGSISGYADRGIAVFKGVPYGADTSATRFLPPKPAQPWEGVREALHYGPACPQTHASEPYNEDCLYLNVWAPEPSSSVKSKPVLVYLHGGAYAHGSGSSPLYDGVNLCRRGEVVVVTLNHRLNAFGHLFLGNIAGSQYRSSGNTGILDIVQALHWIQDNIGVFGGDPNNVTLFGQSGGGAKIATLMAMPVARGLFHQAWTMSGQQVTAAGERSATRRADAFLDALAISSGEWQKLLQLPTEKLVQALETPDPSLNRSLHFCPVLDEVTLSRHPFYPDAPDISKDIPMVIGNTRGETRAFLRNLPGVHELTWETLPEMLHDQLFVDIDTELVIRRYREIYPNYSPTEIFFAASTAGRSWRGAVIEAEQRARQGSNTHVYQLDWPSPLEDGRLGAFHGLDIGLVFDNTHQAESRTGDTPEARRMAHLMSESLLAFAHSGNPNHKDLPDWAPYTLQRRETMLFNLPPRLANDPRGEERRLFEKVPFLQRGIY